MIIEKLEIKGFGKISNMILPLDKGLNLVYGENESGKTTLQWFIKGMLYGLKGGRGTKDGLLPPLKNFKPWNSEAFNGILQYRLNDGKAYQIGRNFTSNTTRIFDELFNDITNTFEISKEKGVQFAEKHLGMNETCFERTAFIKQLETRIDEAGSKELFNKLLNIYETGYEDLSLKNAQMVLKEAMKSYVGTDKTSTRPLDIIHAQLSTLSGQKESICNKKTEALHYIEKLEQLNIEKTNLAQKISMLDKEEEKRDLYKKNQEQNELLKNLNELLDELSQKTNEHNALQAQLQELALLKKDKAVLSTYGENDCDQLHSAFIKFQNMTTSNFQLSEALSQEKALLERIERNLLPLKEFSSAGNALSDEIHGLIKDREKLKEETTSSDIILLSEKIGEMQFNTYRANTYLTISAILSVFSIIIGSILNSYQIPLYVTGFVFLSLFIGCFVYRKQLGKQLSDLRSRKRLSFISTSSVNEQAGRIQNRIQKILDLVGAFDIEDFFRLKAVYDALIVQYDDAKTRVSKALAETNSSALSVSLLKNELSDVLIPANILQSKDTEISIDLIQAFRNGVRDYQQLFITENSVQQKSNAVLQSIQQLLKRASSYCGYECLEIEDLKNKIQSTKEVLHDLSHKDFSDREELFTDDDILLHSQRIQLSENYQNTLLQCRETETMLKNTEYDEESLQRVEEEIECLFEQKQQLQNISTSLKIAIDTLTDAGHELQKDYGPHLNEKMSKMIDQITNGRYTDLRADSQLSLNVVSPETADVVRAIQLSGGTIDQFYLALRLAMIDILTSKGETVPLIMDEVFAQYDDNRTKETFSYLQQLSQTTQIILFTCKKREVEIAREICGDCFHLIEL